MQPEKIEVMDWNRIFLPETFPPGYLWEIGFRTLFMFLFLIILLKFLSKRGVKQMSVFELAILIALGSATGDPMFYQNIPVTHGVTVLVVVIVLYRIITSLSSKSRFVESLFEGTPKCLITDGVLDYRIYKKIGLPSDKFFAELRLKGVDHLGQLKKVYLETSGEMSVFFLPDAEVIPGLPIYPEILKGISIDIDTTSKYACVTCGTVQQLGSASTHCRVCNKKSWAVPSEATRVK